MYGENWNTMKEKIEYQEQYMWVTQRSYVQSVFRDNTASFMTDGIRNNKQEHIRD